MVVKIDTDQHYMISLIGAGFALFLYYTLVYLIIPLLNHKKWFWATLAFIIYYIVAVTLRTYHISLIIQWYNFNSTSIKGSDFWLRLYQTQFSPPALLKIIFSGLTSLVVIVYIPLTIKFLRYAYQFTQKQAWIMKENTQLQLNTLRAQLNPHFFFNTLNNLQSFIVQNEKEKSVDLLGRLADFMRSSLYDGEKEYISMENEIKLLSNYIAIERVRFEEDADIHCQLTDNDSSYQIPAFIFLPFIENIFKHGGALPTNEVDINIELSNSAYQVILETSNRFDPHTHPANNQGGIGLQNVKKRLDYYFQNKYELNISTLANTFNVRLQINK
jgi:two-component system LytT family sensor kinase